MHLHPLLATVIAPGRSRSNFDTAIHAGVVALIVILATAAGDLHVISGETVGNTYLGALGYAAGRSGTTGGIRTADLAPPEPPRPGA